MAADFFENNEGSPIVMSFLVVLDHRNCGVHVELKMRIILFEKPVTLRLDVGT